MTIRTAIPKSNFASGQIDRDVKSRYDLPLLQNGHEISRNFFHTVKGDCYYRPGFEFLGEIGHAALYEFKFNQDQAYLMIFRIEYIEFWTYNENNELVQVLDDDGNVLTLTHPWGTEVYNLCMTQNCDVMYITHLKGEYCEYQLKRTAANAFTLTATSYTNKGTASLSSSSASSNHGFPCTCCFYENRLNRCSSTNYPTYLYGSEGATYDTITVGTGTNDGYQFDLSEANSRALWLESGINSLVVGTAEGILTVNGGSKDKAITPEDISAKLSCRDGVGQVKPIHKDDHVFFVSANKRFLYMFGYDSLLEEFKSDNLSKGNYEITKGGISKLANKFDRFGLIYALCGTNILSICFNNDESVNAWSEWTTSGEFIDICTVTRPDGNYDLFANIKREIDGITRYYLERLTDTVEFSRFEDYVSDVPDDATKIDVLNIKQKDQYAFDRIIAEELRNCNHLDCSMIYSGLHTSTISLNGDILTSSDEDFSENSIDKRIWYKTITGREYGILDIKEYISATQVKVDVLLQPTNNTTSNWYLSATHFSGLEHLENETVAVVGNGGYIGDFTVKNGQVDISSANTNKVGTAIIGLKYKGILKSPNLGLDMSSQGTQTFTNMKNIYKIGLELSFSAGGKIGSNLYELSDIQDFDPEGLYDLPPLPIDTYKEINYSDTYDKEKHYFVVQDSPLPLHITSVIPHYKHVPRT